MKVVIIRSRSTDSAVFKLAKSLSQHGYNVRLLVWDRQNTLKTKNGEGYDIQKFTLRAPYDTLTALFYLPIWWVYEFLFLLKNGADIIHACDLDTLYPAIFVKLIKKRKLCYTIYDFYANNLLNGKFLKIRAIIRRIIADIEKLGIGFTDALFLVDESRYEEVAGSKIKKLEYVYNSPPDYFSSQKKIKKKNNSLTIFYAGVIHKSRGLQFMVDAIKDMKNIKLIIAGHGAKRFVENITGTKNKKIECLEWIPYDTVIRKILDADILFAFYDPSIPNNKYASPNKLFEAMMAGKPIIMNYNIAASRIVEEEKCGLLVEYGNIDEIKKAILKLRKDSILYKKLGKNGRKAYEEKYSWEIMEKRLLDTYKDVSNKKITDRRPL